MFRPQINPVKVKGQNLLFAELMFEPKCQQQFLGLALAMLLLRSQKKVFCHLLGNGAAALSVSAGKDVGNHCPGKRNDVKAEMPVKPPVFGGNDGVNGVSSGSSSERMTSE